MNFDLITERIQPETCLDIGANTGQWYSEAKEAWPQCEFLLIEGNPACEEMLAATGANYRIALLGSDFEEVEFWVHPDHPTWTGASRFRENSQWGEGAVPVKTWTKTLDMLLPGHKPDLIKLDCQGAELDILRGGTLVARHAKGILTEVAVSDWNEGAPQEEEVHRFMKELGFNDAYEIEKVCEPGGRHVQTDYLFMR